MLDVLRNNSKSLLGGDCDADEAEMGTKGREIFFFDVERRKWDRDEQYIQSTYGGESKCERRHMGAKATRGSIKNEANPHSSPLRLCPVARLRHLPDGTPSTRRFLVTSFCGDIFSALAGKIPPAVTDIFPLGF